MDIGTKDSLLNFQRYAFEVKFDENPKLARKTIKKIARTYFNQTISSNSDIFVSILANSAASAGWINEKTSLEIFFSMFFGMLLSLDTQVSKLGMKMFIEGIKDNKKQQFRELLSQKNGILVLFRINYTEGSIFDNKINDQFTS
ncbi:MAG: hypothetical protein EZS28_013946 [Streblomastix strix]|uniref:Uncharacterized protein n=1 Tax=Streblomastix strix TaxID=222440 RepID=A0A5J4W6H6_9EUKA|nr:MAG: hypothetical protein EZS28_013946 [Streblomastix strix]